MNYVDKHNKYTNYIISTKKFLKNSLWEMLPTKVF